MFLYKKTIEMFIGKSTEKFKVEIFFSHQGLHPENDHGRLSLKAIASQYMRIEYSF